MSLTDRLVIRKMPGSRRQGTPIYLTEFPYRIGFRDRKNRYANHLDCSYGSDQLSRDHCEIVRGGEGKLHISDLGSRLGTYVNGDQIDGEGVELHNGDVIGFIPTWWGISNIWGRTPCKVELVYQTPLE